MRSRTEVLETAVLGLLNEAPLHGYELRKRLSLVLGPFRALSYGSLYPALQRLVKRGLIVAVDRDPRPSSSAERPRQERPAKAALGRRGRIVYELTPDGKDHLHSLLTSAGPATWEDENFDVRFSLFAQTDAETRLRILEGRRTRLAERLEAVSDAAAYTRSRVDEYTRELQRFGQEKVEREVDWIDRLIRTERSRVEPGPSRSGRGRAETSRPRPGRTETTRVNAAGGGHPQDPREQPQSKERG